LGIYPPVALGDSGYSDWALHCVKDFCPIVGISCEGHEEQTLALLTAIEEEHWHEEMSSLSNFKGCRELRNLEYSINYNARGESSCRGKSKACVF
jgi:hypothetical protein